MDECSSNENDVNDFDIIDISKSYSFNNFMDKLLEDKTKVFYSDGQLYFMKDDKLKKTVNGTNETLCPICEDVTITTKIMNQKFYNTNMKINHVISKIKHEEMLLFLQEGYTLIHVDEDNYYSMTLYIEDGQISYCITDLDDNNLDPEECNEHYEIVTDILFNSLLNGTWFIIDDKEE